ncbi:MAG: hypothetical protein MZV70_35250 [Desulfobacterales bacterium]|nr:hypothetical protein [Desulfobacterales bacterium]
MKAAWLAQRLSEAEAAIPGSAVRASDEPAAALFLDRSSSAPKQIRGSDGEVEAAIVDFERRSRESLAPLFKIREPTRADEPSRRHAKPGGSVSSCIIVKNEDATICLDVWRAPSRLWMKSSSSIPAPTMKPKTSQRLFGAQAFMNLNGRMIFRRPGISRFPRLPGIGFLVLDADETLSSGDCEEFRRMLQSSVTTGPPLFAYRPATTRIMVNTVGFRPNRGEYPEEEGLGWYPSDKVRLFPNDPRIHFDYPVHELVGAQPARFRKCRFANARSFVHHYGVLDELHALNKTSNYRKLGRKKIKKHSKV